jgi:hypothetical protein
MFIFNGATEASILTGIVGLNETKTNVTIVV